MPPVPPQQSAGQAEVRLYVLEHESWIAAIKHGWSKEYCFAQNPGENHYHLLMSGEIYLQRGTEKYCLSCALRHGYVTRDRTFWQKGPSSVTETPIRTTTDEGYEARSEL